MKFTRRNFLQFAMGMPFAASLGRWRFLGSAGDVPAVRPLASKPAVDFSNPHIIRYDANCFTLRDRDLFLFSAEMHYPRCPRALWRDRLEELKRAGFNTIQTYVFWNYHEPEEGRADLGAFEDFIKLVGELGFFLIVRPGPYVCAEWDAGGFPHWVIAKRFPLRSNDVESIRTSQHWFDLVLPVIRRHQITKGGPIILMQLENEYDYFNLPDDTKREYITALAKMAWTAGIEVPLITCWTKQVRERGNAELARIADFCNFYPRWKIVEEVAAGLQKLRKEQPDSPVGVVELQGGWFTEFGGKPSEEQEGIGSAQLNALSKTVMEYGATLFNYYMGFGGTNFDWAGKNMTTGYDYLAPLSEAGGLGEKYYVARGIGESLKLFGDLLTRAAVAEGAESSNKAVSITLRVNGPSGVLFVRENANAAQSYRMSFRQHGAPEASLVAIPRQGDLPLGPREMKMLPVEIPVTEGHLRYSTAEVLAHGSAGRPYLILYDEPGRLVEIALRGQIEPPMEGDTVYSVWDKEQSAIVIGMRVGEKEKMFLLDQRLQIILLPRALALRTWIANAPITVGAQQKGNDKGNQVPFISNAARMSDSGKNAAGIWADLYFSPGESDLVCLVPSRPAKCLVNGKVTHSSYDSQWRTLQTHITTPALPVQPIDIKQVDTWVERFDTAVGHWLAAELRPLEELGPIPYGYVKYRSQFDYGGESKLALSLFADDAAKLFLNGKSLGEMPAAKRQAEFDLASSVSRGTNTLEIGYELFGSPNFGEHIGELKGIESVSLVGGNSAARKGEFRQWQVQMVPAAMRGRQIDPAFSIGAWQGSTLGGQPGSARMPAFTWCRAEFPTAPVPTGWEIPWRVHFEADCDALLYLNGKFVGRYMTIGPQKKFFLPDSYLKSEKGTNILTIVLAYTADVTPVRLLRIEPYEEYATHRTRIEFDW